ncbi:superoxide dismutase family protein [Saccharopolyspora taberi]|uniref:Superoxide dismutase family protein n=1 Tax=Saccharopolyspora taberi TaxID=60895 RepID=A0ABN3VKJ5_9PSEU
MLHQRTRALGSLVGLCTVGALLAACGEQQAQTPPAEQQPGPAPIETTGTYEPYREGATAVTYKPDQVPPGSTAKLGVKTGGARTEVTVALTGLQPNRVYGAHVHTKPCGPTGDDAGPHFQQIPDPAKPSVDPKFANPENEVWLDFHTDAQGNGTATATGTWQLDRGDAQSFVVHETHTHTEPGKAGTAGGRLACLTAKF